MVWPVENSVDWRRDVVRPSAATSIMHYDRNNPSVLLRTIVSSDGSVADSINGDFLIKLAKFLTCLKLNGFMNPGKLSLFFFTELKPKTRVFI